MERANKPLFFITSPSVTWSDNRTPTPRFGACAPQVRQLWAEVARRSRNIHVTAALCDRTPLGLDGANVIEIWLVGNVRKCLDI
ncbi:hypothetical protein PsorP6_005958 [Peronosclerospora sorghi]|uniref:Uncharacterized protein n=1 Tax=Peronosclerospora sorghi TaxID=230839 RepID=A0ACC0W403_9STRA|nr:hypothetical protein PsorP6_005958 [Peronosclerospora sorghi]